MGPRGGGVGVIGSLACPALVEHQRLHAGGVHTHHAVGELVHGGTRIEFQGKAYTRTTSTRKCNEEWPECHLLSDLYGMAVEVRYSMS